MTKRISKSKISVKNAGRWIVRLDGGKNYKIFSTKKEAISAARSLVGETTGRFAAVCRDGSSSVNTIIRANKGVHRIRISRPSEKSQIKSDQLEKVIASAMLRGNIISSLKANDKNDIPKIERRYDVFINCPFDQTYKPLFEAILFSVYMCGYRPRCAREADNSGEVRIEKINRIIQDCDIGIHDISRTELDKKNKLPRFNMPFELGLFLGVKASYSTNKRKSLCIIFDKEDYRFQKFISDIAGQDIKSHDNNPLEIIRHVRHVLNSWGNSEGVSLPGPSHIQAKYEQFIQHKPELLRELKLVDGELSYADETKVIECFIDL